MSDGRADRVVHRPSPIDLRARASPRSRVVEPFGFQVDRADRKADGPAGDGGVDPDQLAGGVVEAAAAIAGGGLGVGVARPPALIVPPGVGLLAVGDADELRRD